MSEAADALEEEIRNLKDPVAASNALRGLNLAREWIAADATVGVVDEAPAEEPAPEPEAEAPKDDGGPSDAPEIVTEPAPEP